MKNILMATIFAFDILCAASSFSMNQTPNMSITISNDTLNLDLGDFQGNIAKAIEAIQAYCNCSKVEFNSLNGGRGNLNVNGKKHSITPYGITIPMMLRFCNLEDQDFKTDF